MIKNIAVFFYLKKRANFYVMQKRFESGSEGLYPVAKGFKNLKSDYGRDLRKTEKSISGRPAKRIKRGNEIRVRLSRFSNSKRSFS